MLDSSVVFLSRLDGTFPYACSVHYEHAFGGTGLVSLMASASALRMGIGSFTSPACRFRSRLRRPTPRAPLGRLPVTLRVDAGPPSARIG